MTPAPSRLLVVDDELNRGETLSVRLADHGYAVESAKNNREALEKIRSARFDLVVLEQMAPGMSGSMTGLDLLRLLRATYSSSELPVIVVTPAGGNVGTDRELIEGALQSGANDYVRQPANLPEVASRIETQLSRAKTEQSLRLLDPLTGLGNRFALLVQLDALLARSDGEKSATAALLRLDIDGFQCLNDSLGDGAGDDLLKEVANRVQNAVNSSGWVEPFGVARIGSDEFAVAGACEDRRQLDDVAAAIQQNLNRPLIARGLRFTLSASVGIARAGGETTSAEGLLRDAHLAMESARLLGGNRSEFFHAGLRERAQNRMSLALELQDAVEQNRLTVLYQPKVNLREGRIDGFEALLRWRRANGQDVQPTVFIPIAEETGSIQKIGAWVLRQACRQLASWQRQFPTQPPLTMNVNVSVKQLTGLHLVEEVQQILNETGIVPETLKLELTESVLMPEIESVRDILAQLRSLRVGLKLDDFGTGYSSLSYLRSIKFDSLKISRSFVGKLGTDRRTRAIVQTIIDLAHTLNMSVVAEGIETEKQLSELKKMGCELGQGFLFHKPLDCASVENLLKSETGYQRCSVA